MTGGKNSTARNCWDVWQAIRNHPLLYLRLGLEKFVTTIGQPPYRLGSDLKGNHHLLAADPLRTDSLLPPPGETVLKLPRLATGAARIALRAVFSVGQIIYPIAIFFVLTAYGALIVGGSRLQNPRLWHLLAGALLLGMIYVTYIPQGRLLTWVVRGVCALLLLLQIVVVGRNSESRIDRQPKSRDSIVFTFLALMFFVSLWLSWQMEVKNTRNVLPYLPFLSGMLAIALRYWLNAATRCFDRKRMSSLESAWAALARHSGGLAR
jgi:hypothetical protein